MISPLVLRQIFQTAHLEGVRSAHEMGEQLQREAARKKVAEDHAAEDQASVRVIQGAERSRTEERKGRQQSAHQGAHPGTENGEAEEGASKGSAVPAEPHLDFLA